MGLTNLLGSPGRTVVATSVLVLVATLFSGFLANKEEMPWALRWITFVSPFRWAGGCAWCGCVGEGCSGVHVG